MTSNATCKIYEVGPGTVLSKAITKLRTRIFDGGTKKNYAKTLEEDPAIMPPITVQKCAETYESGH